ncbi:MAG: HypC/HybG/HupF family hydrogenase formation chaperone [Thermoplasmata archaeon]|nr:HypC/HybG/HupF family hydrogenase formation chaperone [Thermoplasmata archaeon]
MCLAIPGRIVQIDGTSPADRSARVDFGIAVKSASLVYTPEAQVGDFVVVHAGFATRLLSESEAREALEYAREADEMAAAARPSGSVEG